MGITKIDWTKYSWNPWVGCFKVSPGCKNCYMYRDQNRYGNDPKEIRRTKAATFNAPLKWHEKDPGLVFTSSFTDFFLPEAFPGWRDDAWDIIRRTPRNTYQILTKRPQNFTDMLPADWGDGYPNVWLGVSVENQEMADYRIPLLLNTQAKVRFLSCEPMLGPIDLTGFWKCECGESPNLLGGHWRRSWNNWQHHHEYPIGHVDALEPTIDWVIAGGESGLAGVARPMHPYWPENLKNDCVRAGVPFFFKQWGRWGVHLPREDGLPDGVGRPMWPTGRMLSVNWGPDDADFKHSFLMAPAGKKKTGRYLDGEYWEEFPKGYDANG